MAENKKEDSASPAPEIDRRIGKTVGFRLINGFHFEGKYLGETETHYRFFDFVKKKEMELLKTSVERAEWEDDG